LIFVIKNKLKRGGQTPPQNKGKRGEQMKKKILKFWKEEKTFIFMFCFMVFLMVGYVRAINTINELKIENQDLLEMLDYQIPTEEEND